MKLRIFLLNVLLVAQLGLVYAMYQTGTGLQALSTGGVLVNMRGGAPDELIIDAEDDQILHVRKQGDAWVMPSYFDAPANTLRLNGIMTSLAGLRPSRPIATSESAAERFRVSETGFRTRLTLKRGGEVVGRVFAGDSPGARLSYVRVNEESGVYETQIAASDLSTDPVGWVDRDLFHLDAQNYMWVAVGDTVLLRREKAWLVRDRANDEVTDQTVAKRFETLLSTISFDAIIGTDPQLQKLLDKPQLRIEMQMKDQEPMRLVLSPYPPEPGTWVMKRTDLPYFVRLPDYLAKPLLEFDAAKLLSKEAKPQS